uniref:Hormonesensitive lipase putative n=1 Tax=Albugo laibachii Nc14 TaxID=890382 RepID=F0W931_9STRA|nr:hormonesensitive lipase putative [Albugo laibachii Nc14]|eukprot:CCA17643.1 hormonesensitive lipase putative [Albugo laibachii Nc14]
MQPPEPSLPKRFATFTSPNRSQSSLQLYGSIEHCHKASNSEENHCDEDELRALGYDTLMTTSTSVLSCIQILRRIIQKYAYGRVGRELQHLSLTVASFERVLYTFIRDEIILASETYCEQKSRQHDHLLDLREKTALKDIIPLIPRDERFTILSGGVASLLRNATKSLEETKQVLETLQSSYDPNREARWSFRSMLVVVTVYFGFKRLFSRRPTALKRILMRLFPSKRDLFKYIIGGILVLDYYNRFMYRFSTLRRLKVHHGRVLMTLRLFLLCQYVLQRTRSKSGSSSRCRLLIDSPMESDIDDDLKNATTLLVERVPLPAEYYDRSCEPIGLTAFKIGINTLLASSAFAHYLLRRGSKKNSKRLLRAFGPMIVWCMIPYYAIRAKKAARYASRVVIDHADVDVIRLGWNVYGESRLVQFLTSIISKKLAVSMERFLPYNDTLHTTSTDRRENESDFRVMIFSVRPLNSVAMGTWDGATEVLTPEMKATGLPQKRLVLLYIHGGGFFGRFLQSDLYNTSMWAAQVGAVIVYVDYGLTPETQFPVPLQQCFQAYKWLVNGGLGFSPDRVVLFGESAGGNLAAACCIKCIQENLQLPAGMTLMYPALSMHLSPSPSRFLHQSDPVLPRGIMELSLNSYYPSHGHSSQYKHNIHDPLVSPGLADDEDLKHFPPTALSVGDLDPLLDDSVDLYTRLTILNVPATLKIYQGLSHGYIIYGNLVPQAQRAIDETCERVQKLFLVPDDAENDRHVL